MNSKTNPIVSLKLKYPIVIKVSLTIVLVVFIFMMYLFPKFQPKFIVLHETRGTVINDKAVITKIEDIKIKAPSRPTIPIESTDENFDSDISFTIPDLKDPTYKWDDPPPPSDDNELKNTVPFKEYDEPPEPIGGFATIQRNVVYPEIAIEARVEGQVVVRVFIDEKGIVGKCIIQTGIPSTGLNEAAIEAIKKTKWTPAQQRDRNVGVWVSIPVVFKLN